MVNYHTYFECQKDQRMTVRIFLYAKAFEKISVSLKNNNQ